MLPLWTRQFAVPTFRGVWRRCRLRRGLDAWLALLVAVTALAWWLAVSISWAGGRASAPVIVSGTLVNDLRLPLAAVTVDLYYSKPLGQRTPAASFWVGSATTDRDGRFVVRAAHRLALQKYSSRNGGWLKLDLLVGDSSLTLHNVVRRKFVGGRWVGPPTKAGRTDLGVLVLARGQPSVTATTTHRRSKAGAVGWIYGVVVREPGLDPRSGSGGGATVPVAGDTIVARDAGGSVSAVSAQDGSFQMRLPTGLFTVSEDICGVSQRVTIESGAATRVTLEIPNSC
jgi:hypothetical protein